MGGEKDLMSSIRVQREEQEHRDKWKHGAWGTVSNLQAELKEALRVRENSLSQNQNLFISPTEMNLVTADCACGTNTLSLTLRNTDSDCKTVLLLLLLLYSELLRVWSTRGRVNTFE